MTRRREARTEAASLERLLAWVRDADYAPAHPRAIVRRMRLGPRERRAMREAIRRALREGEIVRGPAGKVYAARGGVRAAPEQRTALGIYTRRLGLPTVLPYDSKARDPLLVPAGFAGEAVEGQVVRCELLRPPKRGERGAARVLEVLGRFDAPGMDVRLVMAKFALREEFPPEATEEAERRPARVGTARALGRTERLGPPPVTIDPESARDHDDAIAVVEREGGGFRLFVHIADVAHYVTPGDAIDAEARRRGTSVYFPDRALPMLPERLSSDLCSLRPGVRRLVQSVVLDFDAAGRVVSSRFADGAIRSAARLTYDQVERVIAGESPRGVTADVARMLGRANALRRVLEARRRARGSIDFDLPEPRILLDVAGQIQGVTIEPRNRAHRMVEEFMLAANEAVAAYLERTLGVCLYRVHDAPDPLKIEALGELVASLGVDWSPPRETVEPRHVQTLLEAAAGHRAERVVASAALRSMKQARYSAIASGHFGLAAPSYCHFTSPIRRYPDLVVHRLLRAARRNEAPAEQEVGELDALATSCSELERNAEAAERELLEWKKIAWVATQVGEERDGLVTGVVPFGLFVEIEERVLEGLVRAERLGTEYFDHDPLRHRLRGTRTGRSFGLGDRLRVRVESVDRLLRRVDLVLVSRARRAAASRVAVPRKRQPWRRPSANRRRR